MTTKYYAGIVDYRSGTVVWSLDWEEVRPGVVPVLDSTGLSPDKIGIVFTDTKKGGAAGVATVSATINGKPAVRVITATVMAVSRLTADITHFTVDDNTIRADATLY